MKKAIKINLKLLMNRKEFYFSVTAMLVLIAIHTGMSIFQQTGQIGDYLRTGEYQAILTSMIVDFRYIAILIFPILTTLLFSDSLACEKNDNFNKMLLTRVNYKEYLIAKLTMVFFTSLIIVFLVLTLNYVLCVLIYHSGVYADSFGSSIMSVRHYRTIAYTHVQLYTMLTNFKFALICAFLSLTSAAISLYTSKRVVINFSVMAAALVSFLILDLLGYHRYTVINLMLSDNFFELHNLIAVIGMFIIVNGVMIICKFKNNREKCL